MDQYLQYIQISIYMRSLKQEQHTQQSQNIQLLNVADQTKRTSLVNQAQYIILGPNQPDYNYFDSNILNARSLIFLLVLFCCFLAFWHAYPFEIPNIQDNSPQPKSTYVKTKKIRKGNSSQQIYVQEQQFQPEIRKQYNMQYVDQQFGKSQQFYVNLDDIKFQNPFVNVQLSTFGLDTRIQVGGYLDFQIGRLVDYQKLGKELSRTIPYEVLEFKYNQKLQRKQETIKMDQFKDNSERSFYLNELKHIKQLNVRNQQEDLQFNLAIQLIKRPNDSKNLQAEYYHADRKYNIGQKSKQLPFCLISGSRNVYSKNRYQQFFETVQLLNYTNFHIVYIDDDSKDNSALHIYNYLRDSNSHLKNRIKIIHNYQNLGTLGNLFFHSKLYCDQNDIVIILDSDDGIIGRQALKILSAIYQNQDTWYVYSGYVIDDPIKSMLFKGDQSQYLFFKSAEYRASFEWVTSHMRTFRRKLMDSVLLSSYIEYVVDRNRNIAYPRLFSAASDIFQVITHIELAGNYRTIHIDQHLYHYYGSAGSSINCYRQNQIYSNFLARLKTPFRPLRKLGEKPEVVDDYDITKIAFDKLKYGYDLLNQCKVFSHIPDSDETLK